MGHQRLRLLALMLIALLLVWPAPLQAQDATPTPAAPSLTVFTPYPSQVIGTEDNVNLDIKLRVTGEPQVVQLSMEELPEGWTATFRGGSRIIQAVYVEPDTDASVTLRLEPPASVEAGTYRFVVAAQADDLSARLPIELTVQEKLPPNLAFSVELPTLRGKPSTTFRYNVTLENKGDEDITVNLSADAPNTFVVTYKLSGQEVTDIPLGANESKRLSVEASALSDVAAGTYPITLRARGGEAEATLQVNAEVVGESSIQVTTPDGRLSGQAYAGQEAPFTVIVQNNGSAPARDIQMSASQPSGWSVELDPKTIDLLEPGQQVEVTAKVRPSDKAVAGDYVMTVTARPAEGSSKSVDFRITVLTSTLWGVAGVGLIAVSILVVGLAVMRFGRR
ncbi:MAG: hypothetical protein KatS3mg050_2480 [Litorilinea sp.]|nr:MAG: hypothetical protein KatS3mg050_2480 [Litorilinea sp.]